MSSNLVPSESWHVNVLLVDFLHSTMLKKAIKLMKDDYIEELVTSDPVLCQDKLFQQT